MSKGLLKTILSRWQALVKLLKQQTLTVYFVARHPETPKAVKYLALFIAGYAFSPIDLIPDFIPILGYVDDAIILPFGLYLVIKLTPDMILEQCRQKARTNAFKPISKIAGVA